MDVRRGARLALAAFYGIAGVFHLYATDAFVAIVPNWVPAPHAVVIVTGLCEILGAGALLTRSLRKPAGAMLALYAVCVYPANINQAIHDIPIGGVSLGWIYHGPRLLLQPVFVWWALICCDIIDWPFSSKWRGREKPAGSNAASTIDA
jgi:uncharacterized membrane protein